MIPVKHILAAGICVFALAAGGCSKQPQEVPKAVAAEAALLAEEAKFAMSIREYARAQELLQRALKLHPDKPEYWVTLGMTQRKQDNLRDARQSYEKALGMHKDRYKKDARPEELAQQAFVLALLGKTDEALKLLTQAVKDHPDSPELKRQAAPRGLPRTFQTAEFKALAL